MAGTPVPARRRIGLWRRLRSRRAIIVTVVSVLVGLIAVLNNVAGILDAAGLTPGDGRQSPDPTSRAVTQTTRPSTVSFTYPHDGLKVPRCLEARGTANLNPGEAVFIFVYSAAPKGLGKAFYLQNRATLDQMDMKKWTADYIVVGDATDEGRIIRIMAVISNGLATETLDALVRRNDEKQMDLEDLPEGAMPAGKADVIRLPGDNC